jgi:sec-independent protein translocase protein TatA
MTGWDAPWHWVIIAIVVIALFGYKKMPDAARGLGRSLRIFKTEIKGMREDDAARDEAKTETTETRAISAPPADVVKNRPRPTPQPTTDASANGGAASTRSETPASGTQ